MLVLLFAYSVDKKKRISEMLHNTAKISQLVSGRASIPTQAIWSKAQTLNWLINAQG